MYAYLKGTVAETSPDYVVIEVNDIGYMVYTPSRIISSLTVNSNVKLYTYLHVREDAMLLYGFGSQEEKQMFLRLQTVSGIGPKLAMSVLSTLSVADVAIALVSGDEAALTRVPGLGKKTAQRLILELKEKVDNSELVSGFSGAMDAPAATGQPVNEAVHALTALGLAPYEAQKAVRAIAMEGMNAEDIITAALRNMDRGR